MRGHATVGGPTRNLISAVSKRNHENGFATGSNDRRFACDKENPTQPPVLTVVLSAPKQTIAVGEPLQLTAIARDVNGLTVSSATFTYTNSAPTVANVNTDGRIIGLSAGSASITATSAGISSPPLTIAVTATAGVKVVTMTSNTFGMSGQVVVTP
jgi:uncharacterized protein YjdB